MRQSRRMSMIEAVTNVAVGYGFAVTMQLLVFPLFGLHASLGDNLLTGAVFTVASRFSYSSILKPSRYLGLSPIISSAKSKLSV